MKIRVKIILLFVVVGIVPSVFFGIFFADISEKEIQNKVSAMSDTSTSQTVHALNDRVSYLERIVNMSVQNEVIMESLDKLPTYDLVSRLFEENKIAKHFNAVAYNNDYIKSIILMPNNYSIQTYGAGISETVPAEEILYFKLEAFDFLNKYNTELNQIKWFLVNTGTKTEICVVKKFSYFLYAKPMGTIVFIVDKSIFEDYLSQDANGMISYLTTEEGIDITSSKKVELSENMKNQLTSQTVNTLDNQWNYHSMISNDYLYREIRITRNNTLILTGIISVILVAISLYISFSISIHLKVLINKFKRLETGDFTVDEVLHGKDEFHVLECRYNEMLVRLKSTIDVNYIYQLEKREAELRALQYQINPHFLYNALEIINAMASLERTSEIKEITSCLGRLFRYNMNHTNNGLVYLEEELLHIQNYLYIHNIQLSGRLELQIEADEEVRSFFVVKFLLQPIVENCIQHGFENQMGNCKMRIQVHYEEKEEKISICIMDSGEGMESETLLNLQKMLAKESRPEQEDGYGIGLKNVNDRIKLYYGSQYGLTIESEKGRGTVVTITIQRRT